MSSYTITLNAGHLVCPVYSSPLPPDGTLYATATKLARSMTIECVRVKAISLTSDTNIVQYEHRFPEPVRGFSGFVFLLKETL